MSPDPILTIENVKTIIDNRTIHNDITFSIDRPGVYAIIGESGCGKSLLLREIIGLRRPTAGEIILLNNNVVRISEDELIKLRGRFSVLFQDGALFSSLTVAENIAAPLKERYKLEKNFLDELVNLKLQLSGLDIKHRDKLPAQLSGGMRKRVALARALALDPEVIFLDEPTSGLDPITSRMFDRVIRTIADGLNLTVLLVTHDIDTLLNIVDHVIVLGQGRVLASGTIDEVKRLDNPWIKSYFEIRNQ
jgi:phospholipid/cholesterol/gamma-HCH transport system ATP-binding protein